MDEARKKILARRAHFVAAAIAGLSVSCGKDDARSQPCLSVRPMTPDAEVGPPPPPQPCLSVMMTEDAGPPPMPCLGPPANADCVTPFWYDAQGVKHFKPQCIK